MSTTHEAPAPTNGRRRAPSKGGTKIGLGWTLKLILMALVNALGLYGLFALYNAKAWTGFAAMVVGLILVNFVYFHPRFTAAKYLVPGLVFLLVYQIYVVLYTGYAAFTNYGDGHNSTKADAVAALLEQNESRVPDSPELPLAVVVQGDQIGFLVVDPESGKAELGTATQPLAEVADAVVTDGVPVSAPGWQTLKFADLLKRGQAFQEQVTSMRVPISDNAADGSVRTQDTRKGFIYRSVVEYDEASGNLVNSETGEVWTASDGGNFVKPDGTEVDPGWKVNVGFDNFTRVLTEPDLREPFIGVFIWTFVFAFLIVAISFAIGLFLAVVLNDERMRGRKVYRSLLLLPYAFPAFLSALVWAGLLNSEFGFINQVLLGGADVKWLTDPWLARISVILVNCWLGFPYMFLVCTGALQAIPADVTEAGSIDGASAWQIFRRIKMPLLMVTVAPLLIASFAFNFNNFNTVYMLTGGGPKDLEASVDVGATDILISFAYKLAFGGQDRQYGFAMAISIVIFLVIATISALSFRKTKVLEDLA